jgi:hypothetical protein
VSAAHPEGVPRRDVVHVLRDGRDVAASLRDASRQPWGASWATPSAEDGARRWLLWVRTIQRDIVQFPRSCTVRYEDLLARGRDQLAELYEAVGAQLPLHEVGAIYDRWGFEASATGGADSLVVDGACRGERPGEPDGFFRRGRSGAWQTDLSVSEQVLVHAIAGDLLRELGYS